MVMASFAILPVQFAAVVALLLIGMVTAASSANAAKRVAGVALALIAALLGLAVLGAPAAALTVAASYLFALLLIGAAIIVRLQEAYSSIEVGDIDRADRDGEPRDQDP
jgi:hypothetical protein